MADLKTTNTEETSVVPFSFADMELADIGSIMGEDTEGLNFTFDRVRIPSAGSTSFEIPDPDGAEEDTVSVKEITGVILYNHPAFGYYKDAYTGGNNPPDCGSFDGKTGEGNPGGICKDCPYNQFGSGQGQAKACKNRRMIYLLREGELFPITMSIPSGSLKSFTDYVKRQLTKGRKLSQIVTKITLKKATNATNIAYSQVVFTFVRVLDDREKTALAPVIEQVKEYSKGLTLASIAEEGDGVFVDEATGEVIEPCN